MQQANDSTLARELMDGAKRLSVSAIAKRLRTGDRVIVRWIVDGLEVNGERVRLEALRWSGRNYVTTEAALARFTEKIGAATPQPAAQPVAKAPEIRTPQQRNAAAEAAMRQLGSV